MGFWGGREWRESLLHTGRRQQQRGWSGEGEYHAGLDDGHKASIGVLRGMMSTTSRKWEALMTCMLYRPAGSIGVIGAFES